MSDNLTLTAPERIYLRPDRRTRAIPNKHDFDAVWGTSKLEEDHVEYVRADLVPTWKDAPNAPGLWVRKILYEPPTIDTVAKDADGLYWFRADHPNEKLHCGTGWGRWFGPIPTDGGK